MNEQEEKHIKVSGNWCIYFTHTNEPHRHFCAHDKNITCRCGWSLSHGENPKNCPLFKGLKI